jgi:TRAP-type transport system periplasmic protein
MFRKSILAALLSVFAGAAYAQKVDIIMATLAPKDSAWYKVMEKMGDDWKNISTGKVTLSIRAGGIMGDDPDCVRRLRTGSIQAAALTSAGLGDIDQGVAALQIPMMFDSYDELDYVRNRVGPKIEKRIEDKGYLVLNWGDAGWVQFFSTKPVNKIDDLRKLRLFTWAGDATEEDLWKSNGFKVVPLAATDIALQLETGGIDAVPTTALIAETTKMYLTAKFMCDVKWAPFIGATIISKAVWEKIPAGQRSLMLDAAHKAGDALKNDIREQGTRAVATMEAGEPGHRSNKLKVTTLDAAALADWRKQTEAIYPKMKGKMVPPDLFDEVQRIRDEYRAKVKSPAKTDAPAPKKGSSPPAKIKPQANKTKPAKGGVA